MADANHQPNQKSAISQAIGLSLGFLILAAAFAAIILYHNSLQLDASDPIYWTI